jgi:hypothetical protein
LKTKYLNVSTTWHCKKAGGLFLGLKLNFPIAITQSAESYDINEISENYKYISIKLGLLLFTINFEIMYAYEKQ